MPNPPVIIIMYQKRNDKHVLQSSCLIHLPHRTLDPIQHAVIRSDAARETLIYIMFSKGQYFQGECENCLAGRTKEYYGVNLCHYIDHLRMAEQPERIFHQQVTTNVTDIVLRKGGYELCYVSINRQMPELPLILHESYTDDQTMPHRLELIRRHFMRVNEEELLRKIKAVM